MPKHKVLTPERRVARKMKDRRLLWIEMLEQLRFGSPEAPQILPGNCQDFLDFLVAKYWTNAWNDIPKPRFETHKLKLVDASIDELFFLLPEGWARTEKLPKSEENHPIFMECGDSMIYLDGRCRINKLYRENPNQQIKIWLISEM